MLSQRERAQKLRDKEELEAQRDALKEKLVMHRDKGEGMTAEQLEESKRDLSAFAELETRIKGLSAEIEATPESNPEIGRNVQNMVPNVEISKDNFRASTQYRDAFFRSLMNRGIAETDRQIMAFGADEKRAITDMNGLSITSGAAYLVPESTLNTIQSIITKVSPLSSLVTKFNFNGDVRIPIGTDDTPTNNADGTDTLKFIFTSATLTQMAVVAVVEMENLTLKNGIVGIEQYVAMSIGKYIGLQLENYILNGNSTAWTGIITAIGDAAETYSELDWETLADFLASVDSPYGDDGIWVMRRADFFSKIFSLTDAEGRPLVNTVPGVSGLPGSLNYVLMGRPVVFSSKIPSTGILYGDSKQFILNISQEMIIESDTSAGFAADKMTWRGKVYASGKTMFAANAFHYKTYSA